MEQNEELLRIAQEIDHIIKRRINDIADHTYEEKMNNMIFELETLVRNAKELKLDYESQGLKIGTIEAEGFLRAMLTVESIIEAYKN